MARPAVLFISPQHLKRQLSQIQALLHLPDPPKAAEADGDAVQWQLGMTHLESRAGDLTLQVGRRIGLDSDKIGALLQVAQALDIRATFLADTDRVQQQQQQREQQFAAALRTWAREQQQHQQDTLAGAAQHRDRLSSSCSSGGIGSSDNSGSSNVLVSSCSARDIAAAVENWPQTLVCAAPEWLLLNPFTAVQQRLRGLQHMLIPSQSSSGSGGGKRTANKNKSKDHVKRKGGDQTSLAQSGLQPRHKETHSTRASGSLDTDKQLQLLLIQAPQLISIDGRLLAGRLAALRTVLLQYLRSLQQGLMQNTGELLPSAEAETLKLTAKAAISLSSKAALGAEAVSSEQKQPPSMPPQLEWGPVMEDLLLVLVRKHPKLLLQPAEQLQLEAAKVQQAFPLQKLDTLLLLLQQPKLHWDQLNFLQQTHQLPDLPQRNNLAQVQAILEPPAEFSRQNPHFLGWQAASAAVEQSADTYRSLWGWKQGFFKDLQGGACLDWLQSMEGRWQRLLLLVAGPPWIKTVPGLLPTGTCDHDGSREAGSISVIHTSSRRKQKKAKHAYGQQWPAISLQRLAAVADSQFPYR